MESPATTGDSGFISASPSELSKLIDPDREAAAVQTASQYDRFLPKRNIEQDGTTVIFKPNWASGVSPAVRELACCTYVFDVADFIGPGHFYLGWEDAAPEMDDVWIGFSDFTRNTWNWQQFKKQFTMTASSVSDIQNVDHKVLIVVVCLGTAEAGLNSVSLITGDNKSPIALLNAPDFGSTSGPITLDASNSYDPDGYVRTFNWDFNGDGTWDRTSIEPVIEHTFEIAGKHSVLVRANDNLNATTTGVSDIMIYDEFEDNDDGIFGEPTQTDMDNATPHPGPDLGVCRGSCGAGGYDGDNEDFYVFQIKATGRHTFLLSHETADADLDLELLADDGDGTMTTLYQSSTTSDNESFTFDFVTAGLYYLRVYLSALEVGTAESNYALEVFSGLAELPVAEFTSDPELGSPPMEVEFDASLSTSGALISTYEWDFNGDGTYDQTLMTPATTHTYTALGDYTVRLRITDEDGHTDTVEHGLSVVTGMPVAQFNSDVTEGSTALTVNFDASASSGDNGLVGYHWDFNNDGVFEKTTTVPNAVFTYYLDGDYTVRLQVEDSAGLTDDDKIRISVTPDYDEVEGNDTFGAANSFPGLVFDGWCGHIGPLDGVTPDTSDWMVFEIVNLGAVHFYLDSFYQWGDINMALVDGDGMSVMTKAEHDTDRETIFYHFNIPGKYFLHVYLDTPGEEIVSGYEIEMTFTPD